LSGLNFLDSGDIFSTGLNDLQASILYNLIGKREQGLSLYPVGINTNLNQIRYQVFENRLDIGRKLVPGIFINQDWLLTTTKGERVMQPEYGTNLRLILFELQTTGIEGLVQQEIVDALTRWEPRVGLQFLVVEKTGEREVTVNATFVSKLNQRDFMIPMVFNP